MKKLLFFTLCIVMAMFTSCSKDDEKKEAPEPAPVVIEKFKVPTDLVGTWSGVDLKIGNLGREEIVNRLEGKEKEDGSKYTKEELNTMLDEIILSYNYAITDDNKAVFGIRLQDNTYKPVYGEVLSKGDVPNSYVAKFNFTGISIGGFNNQDFQIQTLVWDGSSISVTTPFGKNTLTVYYSKETK